MDTNGFSKFFASRIQCPNFIMVPFLVFHKGMVTVSGSYKYLKIQKYLKSDEHIIKYLSFKKLLFCTSMTKMTSLMHCMCPAAGKTSVTKFTLIRFFTRMNIFVIFKSSILIETFPAHITFKSFVVN